MMIIFLGILIWARNQLELRQESNAGPLLHLSYFSRLLLVSKSLTYIYLKFEIISLFIYIPTYNKTVAIINIIYEQKTRTGEYPWHAALYLSKRAGLTYICSGSLLTNNHVITAAHCVSKFNSQSLLNVKNFLIYLGKFNFILTKRLDTQVIVRLQFPGKYYSKRWSHPGVQECQVAKIIRHAQYDYRTYSNDVAVIKLIESVQFSDFVRPICLWEGAIDFDDLIGKSGRRKMQN